MVGNLENQEHHVAVRFVLALSFQGECSVPYNFNESQAVVPKMLSF